MTTRQVFVTVAFEKVPVETTPFHTWTEAEAFASMCRQMEATLVEVWEH